MDLRQPPQPLCLESLHSSLELIEVGFQLRVSERPDGPVIVLAAVFAARPIVTVLPKRSRRDACNPCVLKTIVDPSLLRIVRVPSALTVSVVPRKTGIVAFVKVPLACLVNAARALPR